MMTPSLLVLLAVVALQGQHSDADRAEAIRACRSRGASVGPKLIEWKKAEMLNRGGGVEVYKFQFSTHFNGELKRCLVELRVSQDGEHRFLMREIFDAEDGSRAGTLATTRRKGESSDTILKSEIRGQTVPESEVRALMIR